MVQAQVRKKNLIRDGTNISYSIFGSGTQTVVGLHGFCLSGRSLSTLSSLTKGKLVLVDLRGHGGSEVGSSKPSTYFDDCAKDVLAVCKTEKLLHQKFVAHSMGALVLLKLREYADVQRALLVCPLLADPFVSMPPSALSFILSSSGDAISNTFKAMNGAGDTLLRLGRSEIAHYLVYIALNLSGNYHPDLATVRLFAGELFACTKDGIVLAYDAMRTTATGIGRDLSGMASTLVATGNDPLVDWRYLFRRFGTELGGSDPFSTPNVFERFQEGGHMPHLEAQERFGLAYERFLAQH